MEWTDVVFNLEWFLVATVAVIEMETHFGGSWSTLDRSGIYAVTGSVVWSGMVALRWLLA